MCLLAGPTDPDSISSPETFEIGNVLTVPVLSLFSCHISVFISQPNNQTLKNITWFSLWYHIQIVQGWGFHHLKPRSMLFLWQKKTKFLLRWQYISAWFAILEWSIKQQKRRELNSCQFISLRGSIAIMQNKARLHWFSSSMWSASHNFLRKNSSHTAKESGFCRIAYS